jgi:tight adherence protein B
LLSRKRAKRLKLLEEQMPLALDVINRALRAGHPVVSAIRLAADEMGDPIGSEFGLIVDETTYGFEFRDALVNFARRTGSPDAHFFAVSISVQAGNGWQPCRNSGRPRNCHPWPFHAGQEGEGALQ